MAFYDALGTNDSAVKVLGDETLRTIAHEVAEAVRKNVTIDWTVRENIRAQLRVIVKRILRKHGYPPDKQERRRRQCWNKQRCCVMEFCEEIVSQSCHAPVLDFGSHLPPSCDASEHHRKQSCVIRKENHDGHADSRSVGAAEDGVGQ
jgi:hypothetical protein